MKLRILVVCAGLSLGACKDGAVPEGGPGVTSEVVKPTVTETEYTPDESRARVLLKVAPGSTVTAKSAVGQWNFETMTSESGGAQFNVTLREPLMPGHALTLTFEVSKDGKSEMVEAIVQAGGVKALDVKLGFAPSESGDEKRRVECSGGTLFKGEGNKAKNMATLCDTDDVTSYYLAKGETKVKLVATSKDLGSITVAGVKADFVDGKAEVAVDPADAIATSSALAMVGYESRLSLSFTAEGPGGPFWGHLPIATGDDTAKGWLLAAAKGPSLLPNERKRPPRKGVMAAIRKNDATGGLLYGLFVSGLKETENTRIKAQEIDLVAIDSGASTVVGTCKYERASDGEKTDRDQISVTSNVTVYDRKTGAKIASKVFEPGKHPGCSAEIMTSAGNFVKQADLAEIEAWAKSLVTDPFTAGIDDIDPGAAVPVAEITGLVVDKTETERVGKQFLGIDRHATAAQVEKVLGPPSETQPDDVANKSRTRLYLGGTIMVAFGLPQDTAQFVMIVGADDAIERLAQKGIKDPVADLFNQTFEPAGKLLGKPTKSDESGHTWSVGSELVFTDLALGFYEGRCTTLTVMWITVKDE